jgi:4-amino-4-deoxy-L-arabinose transferase-like glycosyltransferase
MIKKIILISILVLGFTLRFYNLTNYPALNADEAALGYNAYSLLETGKDEHGNSWPLHFQSFNDYKPGLYVYLILPFIKFTGLNEFAVRLPGAFLGSLSILVIYFLAKEIKKYSSEFSAWNLELIAALLLAINPWHIHFSRGAWEANVATFFILCGVLFFIKSTQKINYLFLSALFFVLSIYTYHSARVLSPLLVLGLFVFNYDYFLKRKSQSILAFVFGLSITVPLIISLLTPALTARANGVSIFADRGPINRTNEQRGEHSDLNSKFSKLIHNKPVNYFLSFVSNWADHYHGDFLFITGDEIQRSKVPETGQLYLVELFFLSIGIITAIRNFKNYKIILFWLLITPIPAALTFQSPHALRAHNMIIPLTIISALGLSQLIILIKNNFKQKILSNLSYLAIFMAVLWSFSSYMHMYYLHMSKDLPFSSQYGVKELVNFVADYPDSYEHVVVTDRYDQPYILFLFYLKYPPEKFQNHHYLTSPDQYGFSTVRDFDKYTFVAINDWDAQRQMYPNSLIIGTDEEIYQGTNIIKKIYGTNGHLYFEVVKN